MHLSQRLTSNRNRTLVQRHVSRASKRLRLCPEPLSQPGFFLSQNDADFDICRWEKLQAREGLEKDAFEKATWGFLGFVLGRNYNVVISMSKARKYGWTG